MSFLNYLKLLVRRRTKDILESETVFHRCLKSLDVTLLGLASMLGAGLYITTGAIARNTAGPAIVLSLLIAAIPACLCSLCYAEFGSRISRTGSSYTYTYFVLGEIWAFWVGWTLILENTIAVALLGHEISRFIDNMAGGHIYGFFTKHISNWQVIGFLRFPDFLAFGTILIFTIVSAVGVRKTASFIRVATLINILVLLFVILAGIYYVDTKNWNTIEKFAPFGFHGIMAGAASSYFAYLGFDTLNTASEETIQPRKIIPCANTISTYAGVVVYLVVAGILTLMIPYHQLSPGVALPDAFIYQGFPLGKYFVAVGGVFAMTTSLVTYLFSGSRIMYAMANDGLLFEFFGSVNVKTQAPVRSVFFCGLVAAIVALFVDTNKLVEMLSIGTMLAYTMVAISVLLDRYKPPHSEYEGLTIQIPTIHQKDSNENKATSTVDDTTCCKRIREVWHRCDNKTDKEVTEQVPKPLPDSNSFSIACTACATMVISTYGFALAVQRHYTSTYIMAGGFAAISLFSVIVLCIQPRYHIETKYSVPYVPTIPILSILINEYILTNLSKVTWASFTAWSFLGKATFSVISTHISSFLSSLFKGHLVFLK